MALTVFFLETPTPNPVDFEDWKDLWVIDRIIEHDLTNHLFSH